PSHPSSLRRWRARSCRDPRTLGSWAIVNLMTRGPKEADMRVGGMTGGGDSPGLNAVIRAVVRKGVGEYGFEFVGFLDGWRGPLENLTKPLGLLDEPGHLA